MTINKSGFVVVDCNASSLDMQPVVFLLEYSSVLCITISGTEKHSLNACYKDILHILSVIGRYDVPVIKGYNPKYPNKPNKAAMQITEICNKFPHKITVVCLGPLSNISSALTSYRSFEKNVKRIVFLADGYNGTYIRQSLNIKVDKVASRHVFTSNIPIILIPSNVKCSIPLATYLALRDGATGLFSTLFNCYDDDLLSISQKMKPGYVCLKKEVTAMIALNSNIIADGVLMNFRGDGHYSNTGADRSSSTNHSTSALSSCPGNRTSTLTSNVTSSVFSSNQGNHTSSRSLRSSSLSPTYNLKLGNNVLVVKHIRKSEVLRMYRRLYLLGITGPIFTPY